MGRKKRDDISARLRLGMYMQKGRWPAGLQNWRVAAARQRSETGGHSATEGPGGWVLLVRHRQEWYEQPG